MFEAATLCCPPCAILCKFNDLCYMLLVSCHGHNLTLDAVTIKSSTSDDRNDAENVTGCPQIILEDGGKTQIALVAAACSNKKQRAGSGPLPPYSSISASSSQAS